MTSVLDAVAIEGADEDEGSAELFAIVDPNDARLAHGATGLLRVFNQAGVLTAADVHVANRLGDLGGEPDERVRLAAALAVRGVRRGSVCVDLTLAPRIEPGLPWPEPAEWVRVVQASRIVGEGLPLRWEYDLLYLDRYRRQEQQVRDDLLTREAQDPPEVDRARLEQALDRLFPDRDSAQRLAAEVAATRWTSILGGGPGTGKTTTVARLLAALLDQPGPTPRIALAAPTGKAAARLQGAVHEVAAGLDPDDQEGLLPLTAMTVHRLLGWLPGNSTRFRHDRENRLPYDVVVVDETSMLSLTMMARLLEALRPDARLILVGDPDQLASVEAGAVLADLTVGLTARAETPAVSGVVLLRRTFRFGGAIAALAAAVRDGDADAAIDVLRSGDPSVTLTPQPDASVRDEVISAAEAVRGAAERGDAEAALAALDGHRLLCAHRSGPQGATWWGWHIERWLADARGAGERRGPWYPGRPLLVTENNPSLKLFNGDTGVVALNEDGQLRAVFPRQRSVVAFTPERLSTVQTMYAMTVHRSQGSQFERVTFVLPPATSTLSTRELLYTGVSRAQLAVQMVGTEAEVRAAIARVANRASGLRVRLAQVQGLAKLLAVANGA